MCIGGGMKSIKIVLRNPLDKTDTLDYNIEADDSQLSHDWMSALGTELQKRSLLEKNFCFLGFPRSARNLPYLCNELNAAVFKINLFNRSGVWQKNGLAVYTIEDYYTADVVRFGDEYPMIYGYDKGSLDVNIGLGIKHGAMNRLHNHFEVLQGTVEQLSPYYQLADYETKYAIRQLNNLCHEIENLVLSQRQQSMIPEWVRPTQITTFLQAERYALTDKHRQGFLVNGFDRVLGGVYMHWTQIGKTLFEVFKDEGAPELTDTVCEAITELKYYSGEFDVEWGKDTCYGKYEWFDQRMDEFATWLEDNDRDPNDASLSLGYLHLGQVTLQHSFGTTDVVAIHQLLSNYLDIYQIEVDGKTCSYDYCWTDLDYKQQQINMMKPGYDYSSRR
jgi:hypothetical protein